METVNTPTPDAATAETGSQKGSVGALLRATRVRLGVDLATVAETLHIRVAYLEAIETGNYEALPGGTYAVGFIRSYADQLGLDGKEMVRRFKLETGTQPQLSPQPVNFPKPVKTLGMPVGSIVTGVVVVAGLLFGAWYLLSGSESTTLLPKLPAALNETINAPAPKPAPPEAAPEPVSPPPAAVAPAPEATKPVEPPKSAEPPKPAAEAPKPAPAPVAPPKPEVAKPVEPPKPVAEAPKPAQPPAAPPRPAVEDSPDSAPVGPETVTRTARVYGEENSSARVELVATADSWVQVTENGSLVLTRLLHPGDRFRVPNRAGLTLMTGNAGGLEVLVDGGKVSPLGNPGQVVRDVPLDAERLRGGR